MNKLSFTATIISEPTIDLIGQGIHLTFFAQTNKKLERINIFKIILTGSAARFNQKVLYQGAKCVFFEGNINSKLLVQNDKKICETEIYNPFIVLIPELKKLRQLDLGSLDDKLTFEDGVF